MKMLLQYGIITCCVLRNHESTAFTHSPILRGMAASPRMQHLSMSTSGESAKVQKLLEQAAKIRSELAELEGKTLSQVEKEAQDEKEGRQLRIKKQREEDADKNILKTKKKHRPSHISARDIRRADTPGFVSDRTRVSRRYHSTDSSTRAGQRR